MNISTVPSSNQSPVVATGTTESQAAMDDKICWIEVKTYPYKADHQVELLHLQAEADALLVELQAVNQRRINEHQRLEG